MIGIPIKLIAHALFTAPVSTSVTARERLEIA